MSFSRASPDSVTQILSPAASGHEVYELPGRHFAVEDSAFGRLKDLGNQPQGHDPSTPIGTKSPHVCSARVPADAGRANGARFPFRRHLGITTRPPKTFRVALAPEDSFVPTNDEASDMGNLSPLRVPSTDDGLLEELIHEGWTTTFPPDPDEAGPSEWLRLIPPPQSVQGEASSTINAEPIGFVDNKCPFQAFKHTRSDESGNGLDVERCYRSHNGKRQRLAQWEDKGGFNVGFRHGKIRRKALTDVSMARLLEVEPGPEITSTLSKKRKAAVSMPGSAGTWIFKKKRSAGSDLRTDNMDRHFTLRDMEVDPAFPTIICDPCHQNHQSETMDVLFDEQLTTTLDENFPYINTDNSPPLDFDWDFIEEFMPHIISNDNNKNNHNNDIVSLNVQEKRKLKNKEEAKKQEVNGGTKRKRQPTQVQDHIIAERKRREILGQMFISLSTIIPGLKKTDKTTVLGEAIKYMKQLQETVKTLEEVAEKKIVESIVVVKKSKLIVSDDEGGNDNASSSTVDDNCAIDMCGSSAKDGSRYEAKNLNDLKPEIETKISGQTLLIRVYCEQHKGILAKLITEVENHDMRVTNCSAVPFESLGLDITIVTQIEKGFTENVKECVRRLHSSLQLASH
ncbi:hypothetical protein BVRB_6g152990 [Beta vulgaris subsp. vulgaris]|nr:hypothetical protein BVRB_6g152990 [Beta vulgaris subsp. vulgaris]